jgi:hypothetical protein
MASYHRKSCGCLTILEPVREEVTLSELPFSGPGNGSRRPFPWWVLLGAVLLPCIYVPTLRTPFDFIDDGNLVYPATPLSASQRLALIWQKTVANYQHLGPFRPVLWAHWQPEADLLNANPHAWRAVRLFWTMLAAGAFLWLLRELGIRPGAALLAGALAFWNPYRNEIWTSLTLAEGVAMPYALLGLVCAVRAARSSRPALWDIGGALCVLAALGCKNTFAALVPAQVLLRIAPDGRDWRAGWRLHGRRACFLALTLLLPVGHYIYFKLNWHAGQYTTRPDWLGQLGRMLSAVQGAISADFLAPGLVLAVLTLFLAGGGLRPLWESYRGACLAGLALLVFGIGIYLPIGAISGRYAMPAVWGADLGIAALLSTLAAVPRRPWTVAGRGLWKPVAFAVLGCCLAAVAVANVGRQYKFAARADLLWQALEWVERRAGPQTCVAWVSGPELNAEEGIHFQWHLWARGRRDVTVRLLDHLGRPQPRSEQLAITQTPDLLVSGTSLAPPGRGWHLAREVTRPIWGRRGAYYCYLWTRE